jgi:glucokinase
VKKPIKITIRYNSFVLEYNSAHCAPKLSIKLRLLKSVAIVQSKGSPIQMLDQPPRYCIAIDIGGSSAKLAIVSKQGKIFKGTSTPTPKVDSPGPLIEALTRTVIQLLEHCREIGIDVEGIGIGHPGFYEEDGKLKDLCNIPALNGFNLRAYFQQEFQRRVASDTDVSCGTLGEFHFGGHQAAKRFLFVTLGTGIGAGVILNNRLVRMTRNCLGDPGHIVVDPDGSPCTCGGKGCLEAVASGWAMERQAEQAIRAGKPTILASTLPQKKSPSPQDIFQAASAGDEVAKSIVANVAKWLAMGLATFCVIFEPEIIVLGGGIATGAGQCLSKPVRDHLFRIISPPFARHLELISAKVGSDAGLLGAAALILFQSPVA